MSGYRSLHREVIGSFPIWHVACSGSLSLKNRGHGKGRNGTKKKTSDQDNDAGPSWQTVVACGDGIVRIYNVREKSIKENNDVLDASAVSCTLCHMLVGQEHRRRQRNDDDATLSCDTIGISQVRIVRNYVGEDDTAGDILVVSINMIGRVRIWVLPENLSDDPNDEDDNNPKDSGNDTTNNDDGDAPKILYPIQEFVISDATGTCIWPLSPTIGGVGDIKVAVPCLDGSIKLVSTGILTPNKTPQSNSQKQQLQPTEAGTVLECWSRGGAAGSSGSSSIALCGVWHPTQPQLTIGRQDGLIDTFGVTTTTTGSSSSSSHRLIHHEAPVRAVTYTTDGQLLITGSDDGMICVWDAGRTNSSAPALVRHVVNAHNGWIVSLSALLDTRRFVSTGIDQKIHIWTVGQLDRPVHTFTGDDISWTIDVQQCSSSPTGARGGGTNGGSNNNTAGNLTRLLSGNEQGRIHIYSMASK